ncbi:MAG: diacylglycerol kinase family protein [Micromonosporaceae bacterium]
MPEVLVLALGDAPEGAGSTDDGCGEPSGRPATPRVPVLACADALRAGGARVEQVVAENDAEIDMAVKTVTEGEARLVVAAATDGEVRAVVRRMLRWYAPPPSRRPAHLPPGRTLLDLPPLAVLPLAPAVPELVARLDLPRDPAAVAAAVLGGRTRRLDLLRTDAGSVTLHAALLGGADGEGRIAPWRGEVTVDDAVLTDGTEPLLACAVANAGPVELGGLPLITGAQADDGLVAVAVALAAARPRRGRTASVEYEVRRARGRAVSVHPRDGALPLLDDGVAARLTHRRAWWTEPAAWATYIS